MTERSMPLKERFNVTHRSLETRGRAHPAGPQGAAAGFSRRQKVGGRGRGHSLDRGFHGTGKAGRGTTQDGLT